MLGVVGVGCSAGGLEALTAFFGQVPAPCGLGFVVVQHLDPTHASDLVELLQRATPLQVLQAGEGMVVRPECIYVIPPRKDLSIAAGTLHLLDPVEPQGLRLAVDFFLRSLAADRQERAVGIVLSGMGSDGALGLRAIKDAGGLTLAQDPATAKARGMPLSAVSGGVADIVAPAEDLGPLLIAMLSRAPWKPVSEPGSAEDSKATLSDITALLQARTGNDFGQYKMGTLQRRVERRMALHQLADATAYLRLLRDNPAEQDLLFKELLIGVTSFFRDAAVWDVLRSDMLPALLQRHPAGGTFRAWVPACSSGEEAYTLAMVFRDAMADLRPPARYTLQIFATDLDDDAITRARKGLYPKGIAQDVGPDRLRRFFVAEDDKYRVARELRDMVIFAQQNISVDPPFTNLDILSCRNLLIYFETQLQKTLLPLFHYALKPQGVLVLGSAETIGHFEHLFKPAHPKHHIYHRREQGTSRTSVVFPLGRSEDAGHSSMTQRAPTDLGHLTDQLIQQTYAPAAVLVNSDGDIVYISGRTGKYLEPAAGRVNINVHAMARPGLDTVLTGSIRKALGQSEPVLLRGIKVGTNGGTQHVDVTVQRLEGPELLRGRILIVFKDVPPPVPPTRTPAIEPGAAAPALAQELHDAREALRMLRDESQSSLQDLKSANEELQATNEELQSTNEELTTSKEEMQAMNEEMRTVNTELQAKVHDLTWERNDMANLLNSTEIATIFLDSEMRLRRFTAFATRLFKLIPSDIGRPLSDLVTELDYPQLLADATHVLKTLVFSEKEVVARDGRCYRARIMPYRTQDNVIDGVVSTFVDITETKALEAELRRLGGIG